VIYLSISTCKEGIHQLVGNGKEKSMPKMVDLTSQLKDKDARLTYLCLSKYSEKPQEREWLSIPATILFAAILVTLVGVITSGTWMT
jgi:hypothetical protein